MNAINPGDILRGRYRVLRPLGAGGFGCTFEVKDLADDSAEDSAKNRRATMVLKVLKLGEFLDPASQKQIISLFQREAKVLSRLRHTGIPRVEPDAYFAYRPKGTIKPLHCLVMEKIEGQDLEAWLDSRGRQPISSELALDWLKQLAEILEKVHRQRYFHRDIKPANIIIRPSGSLALIDFGAVKEITNTFLVKVGAGQPGTGVMSPGYAPFEQSNGKAVPQSDFFALGRTMVHLLTGKSPLEFQEDPDSGSLLWRQEAPAVSEPLADFIDYLMAPFPGKRPANARVILDCLESLNSAARTHPLNPPPRRGAKQAKPRGWGDRAKSLRKSPLTAKLGLALGLLGLIGWPLGAPAIASALNRGGYDRYITGNVNAAKSYFWWAVRLNPQLWMARYNLGSACEDSSELDCARREYQKAIEGRDSDAASLAMNNLGRLYAVREKDYDRAIDLLLRGLEQTGKVTTRSALHKNLGLAYFRQGKDAARPCPYYLEAETHLEKAIDLAGDFPDASDLLARVRVEKQQCPVLAAPAAKE